MKPEALFWIDGETVVAAEARVSLHDRGLLYGEGAFDTMRAYGGRAFRLREHLSRFFAAGNTLGCRPDCAATDIEVAINSLLQDSGLSDAYIRTTMTRGAGGFGMEAMEDSPACVFIAVRPLRLPAETCYATGFRAMISDIRRNETSPLSRVKSLNYLDSLLARREARKAGVDEALMLNTRGHLAEAAASNVFLVQDNALVTPGIDSGVLAGITRSVVVELATAAGIRCEERSVDPEEFSTSTEAFLTNSLMEIVPLTEVNHLQVGGGSPGQTTLHLLRHYRDLASK